MLLLIIATWCLLVVFNVGSFKGRYNSHFTPPFSTLHQKWAWLGVRGFEGMSNRQNLRPCLSIR